MNEIDLTSFWKDMDDAADLLIDTMGRSNAMDRISFGTFCCMIMEEFCRANSLDVIVFAQWIADNVRIMNERNGRY